MYSVASIHVWRQNCLFFSERPRSKADQKARGHENGGKATRSPEVFITLVVVWMMKNKVLKERSFKPALVTLVAMNEPPFRNRQHHSLCLSLNIKTNKSSSYQNDFSAQMSWWRNTQLFNGRDANYSRAREVSCQEIINPNGGKMVI